VRRSGKLAENSIVSRRGSKFSLKRLTNFCELRDARALGLRSRVRLEGFSARMVPVRE
jgi:hypothetical protein